MSASTIELPTLHPAQRQIVDHPARFKVLACGRRFGKTQTALELLVDHILQGHLTAYFAPNQVMTFEVWEGIKSTLSSLISRVRELEWRVEFVNGAVFECWTTRTEAVRGRKYHFVVVDEAALIPSADVWQAVIRPLLTDFAGGALFASTPRGRNWFWHLYNRGQDDAQPDWQSWHFPTSANPHIDPQEVESARAELPERVYKQEYLADFLQDGGAVFRELSHVCVAQMQPVPEPGRSYAFGVDWGRDNDFTVISVVDDTGRQVYLDRFNQISYNVQRDRLKALVDRFCPVVVLAEANSVGAANIDALQAEGIPVRPFYTTNTSKTTLIERFILAIERHEVTLLQDEVLLSEFQAFQVSRTASGFWHYAAPPGTHDDIVIATALSYHAHAQFASLNIDFV